MKRTTAIWIGVAALAILINALVFLGPRLMFLSVRIASNAMSPTLMAGEQVTIKRTKDVAAGDIVMVRYSDARAKYVGRIVATGGDIVEIRNKRLRLNGHDMDEIYAAHEDENVYSGVPIEPYKSRDQFGPYRVPADHFFILGDNRDHSHDSRYRGAVPQTDVIGEAVMVASPTRGMWVPDSIPPTPKQP